MWHCGFLPTCVCLKAQSIFEYLNFFFFSNLFHFTLEQRVADQTHRTSKFPWPLNLLVKCGKGVPEALQHHVRALKHRRCPAAYCLYYCMQHCDGEEAAQLMVREVQLSEATSSQHTELHLVQSSCLLS